MSTAVEKAELALEKAKRAEQKALGWRSMKSAPKDGTRVHLWMEVYASPMSFGMADQFAVPDAWWDGAKWVHEYRGQPAELRSNYIANWMPASQKIPQDVEIWRG